MVNVGVGVNDGAHRETLVVEDVPDTLEVAPRINHDSLHRRLVGNDGAVATEGPNGEVSNKHAQVLDHARLSDNQLFIHAPFPQNARAPSATWARTCQGRAAKTRGGPENLLSG